MIRKFALVCFDKNADIIIDRYNLDLVTAPTGLGFKVAATTIKTDVEELLVKVAQDLGTAKMNVHFTLGNEYIRAKAMRAWIEKYTSEDNRMALEWENDAGKSYADCIVSNFEFGEKEDSSIATVMLTIKMLSPFFEIITNEIKIYPSAGGKVYPYTYPYTYGAGVIENNIIDNTYIKKIPLVITLFGEMADVSVGIRKQGESAMYQEISFPGLSLQEGQYITINAVTRKITYCNGSTIADGYPYIDGSKDSFIFAKGNTVSELVAHVDSDKSGKLEASYRRYRL